MKILKSILIATILFSTLTTATLTASTSNEIEANYCFDNGDVLTLNIPELNFLKDIPLLQSTFDAPVTVELSADGAVVARIEIAGDNALISSDGINRFLISSDGINRFLISSDGINRFLISSDGINRELISSDGINRVMTVTQLGTVIFRDEL